MISLTIKGRIVHDETNRIPLGRLQFDLLLAVHAAEPGNITSDHLALHVWPDGRYPVDKKQSLNTNICHINHHLKPLCAKIITTGQSHRLHQGVIVGKNTRSKRLCDALQEPMRIELKRHVDEAGGVVAFARAKQYKSHGFISDMLSGHQPVTDGIGAAIGYISVSACPP